MTTRLSSVAALILIAVAASAQNRSSETVDVHVLAFNDFHGALEPPAGGNGRIGKITAGGVEYLATHLRRLKATNPNTVVVSAGDNIGGTPLLSSLSHDEAAVEALNIAGLELSAVGNHELDDGWWELHRMQKGGCHPTDGCQDGTPFSGASFKYLSANISLDPQNADPNAAARAGITGTGPRPLFSPTEVREFGGVQVGFVGLTLGDALSIITPAGTRGLTVTSPTEAVNTAARTLRASGVDAVVALFHEGGVPRGDDPNGCDQLSEDIVGFVRRMSDDVDVVVTGHSHSAYICTIGGKLVTSAASNGRVITEIDLQFDRTSGRLMSKRANNVVVTRDVDRHAEATALIAHYRPVADRIGGRVVGTIAQRVTRDENAAGESPLGDVIADALLAMARAAPGGSGDLAFMNAGGIREDLPGPSPITFAQLFEVLPFGNVVIVKTVTGETILQALEQQFSSEYHDRILQVSAGFVYAYDASRPFGQRIDRASVRLNGAPVAPERRYRLVTNDFLWTGGDGFTALKAGTEPTTVGVDVEVFSGYVATHSPVRPGPQDRIRREP